MIILIYFENLYLKNNDVGEEVPDGFFGDVQAILAVALSISGMVLPGKIRNIVWVIKAMQPNV